MLFPYLISAVFWLCIAGVKPTSPSLTKQIKTSCYDSALGSCCYKGTTLTCGHLICPDYLKKLLEQPCLEYTKIAIHEGILDSLPLLDVSYLKTQTLEIVDSTLESFVPTTGNYLGESENNIFKKLQIKQLLFHRTQGLETLDWSHLANSNIRSLVIKESKLRIIPASFAGIWKLERLQVTMSGLTYIHGGIFKNLPDLVDIDLSNNELEFLESESFSLENGFQLNLSNNKLISLPPDVLRSTTGNHLCDINSLNLNNNPLEKLPSEAFRNTCLGKLYLNGTSLKCSCENSWLQKRGFWVCGGCNGEIGYKTWTEYLYCQCQNGPVCDPDEVFDSDEGCEA